MTATMTAGGAGAASRFIKPDGGLRRPSYSAAERGLMSTGSALIRGYQYVLSWYPGGRTVLKGAYATGRAISRAFDKLGAGHHPEVEKIARCPLSTYELVALPRSKHRSALLTCRAGGTLDIEAVTADRWPPRGDASPLAYMDKCVALQLSPAHRHDSRRVAEAIAAPVARREGGLSRKDIAGALLQSRQTTKVLRSARRNEEPALGPAGP